MSTKNLEKTREDIKNQLQNLDIKTIELLATEHSKAVEYFKIGREVIHGSKLTDEEIEAKANEMQAVARMLLKEKSNTL
jgi:hypothetical protein